MVERIAKALDLPEAYFYTKDDELAFIIARFYKVGDSRRKEVLEILR